MSIKIGGVIHEVDAEVMSLIDELRRDRERLQARVSFLEGESAKDLECLRSQAQKLGRVDRLIARAETYCLSPQVVAFLRGCID